jgi:hypothetical protein
MTLSETPRMTPETAPPAAWGWADALLLQMSVIVFAMVAQIFLPRLTHALHWPQPHVPVPWNWILPGGFALLAVVAGALFRRRPMLRWISGVPFAVSAIIIYAALGLLGILLVQDAEKQDWIARWGGRTLFTSLPFLAASLLIMLNLATALGRRLLTPRPGLTAFLCNHVGLLLVMVGMIAGSAQLERHRLRLFTGMPTPAIMQMDAQMHVTKIPLPATLTLEKFAVDFYPPHLVALDFANSGGHMGHKQQMDPEWISTGHNFAALGAKIAVLDYLPSAHPPRTDGGTWTAAPDSPFSAAQVRATLADGTVKTGWVGVGSGMEQIWPLMLAKERFLALSWERAPKRFRSTVIIMEKGKTRTAQIEVNHPLALGPWKLYQTSYGDDGMGGYYSELEAVRDPALPVVYTGLFGMLLGAFLAFWATPRRRIAAEEAAR